MFKRKKKAIVVDIDGTLVSWGREPHIKVIKEIKRLSKLFLYDIIILTARPKIAQLQTNELLNDIGIQYEMLVMKPTIEGDNVEYKINALKTKIMPVFDVKYIFDDDEWNIEAFKELNLRTIKVDPDTGNF